jgi:hypothetical protein
MSTITYIIMNIMKKMGPAVGDSVALRRAL